jgi:hypothetical protein
MDSATFSRYLDASLADQSHGANEPVPVPMKLCVATLTLLQHLMEDLEPNPIPTELMPQVVRLDNLLGAVVAEQSR